MKYLFTGLCLLCLAVAGNTQSSKKALLIGIGKYQFSNHWKSLSSANDLVYLKQALENQKFDKKNIKTLVDGEATYDGIIKALNDLAGSVKKGDIVFFHFSGHGQQIEDNENRDENDGYDEALIPYDAKGKYDPVSYNGEKHLRDDVLQPILKRIRDILGPAGSLIVSLDACHSGTATRSAEFAITRGEAMPFKSPEYQPVLVHKADGFADDGSTASNMIVLSASSPNQVNYETKDVNQKGVGSLSYAMAKALSELPAGANYNMLFNRIKSEIQSNFPVQWPMMEGNGLQQIFEGRYTPYDEIIEVRWEDDNTIRIPAGLLHGITPGTAIDLYITGKNEKVLTAMPVVVGNFETVAKTDKPTKTKIGYHAKWESSIGSFDADVFINQGLKSRSSHTINNQLTQFISRYPNMSVVDNADFMLDINDSYPGKITLSLIEKGDSVRWSRTLNAGDTLTDNDKESLLNNLRYSMKAKFLRELKNGGSLTEGVTVTIVPAKKNIVNGELQVRSNDKFDMHVTNNSDNDIYFTVINLTPSNEFSVLVPADREKPEEFRLKAKAGTMEIKGFFVDANPKEGVELFKVLISRTPMDLRPIFNVARMRSVSNPMSSFETAIQAMVKESNTGTRSGRTNVQLGETGIITVGFMVKK